VANGSNNSSTTHLNMDTLIETESIGVFRDQRIQYLEALVKERTHNLRVLKTQYEQRLHKLKKKLSDQTTESTVRVYELERLNAELSRKLQGYAKDALHLRRPPLPQKQALPPLNENGEQQEGMEQMRSRIQELQKQLDAKTRLILELSMSNVSFE
jgi:hypothetical protein